MLNLASALAQTSGYCCTSNSLQQVISHPDQTQACCTGRFDGVSLRKMRNS
ncbi:hypothetical protein CSPAE12_11956 [Colletotrichum incanum]|nr:hypothetical protein CSPAE12_11956 [Colletotrichum incanum]